MFVYLGLGLLSFHFVLFFVLRDFFFVALSSHNNLRVPKRMQSPKPSVFIPGDGYTTNIWGTPIEVSLRPESPGHHSNSPSSFVAKKRGSLVLCTCLKEPSTLHVTFLRRNV